MMRESEFNEIQQANSDYVYGSNMLRQVIHPRSFVKGRSVYDTDDAKEKSRLEI